MRGAHSGLLAAGSAEAVAEPWGHTFLEAAPRLGQALWWGEGAGEPVRDRVLQL